LTKLSSDETLDGKGVGVRRGGREVRHGVEQAGKSTGIKVTKLFFIVNKLLFYLEVLQQHKKIKHSSLAYFFPTVADEEIKFYSGRHDIQHNDIQHKGLICDTQPKSTLSAICHYAKFYLFLCRVVLCRVSLC
jgi:hypothetical protein